MSWRRRFAEAIPVGVFIPDRVLAQILRWTLLDDRFGVVHTTDDEEVKATVRRMGALFDRSIAGDEPNLNEWDDAANAAWSLVCWDGKAAWDARVATADFYPALGEEVLRLLRELEGAA